jgi:Asp-tRNA(Asn)/Glu-tRNA(Gln) amidotransferase A subunit family amidase
MGNIMKSTDLFALGATEAAEAIRDATISSEELVASCLGRIESLEDSVRAWAHLDPDHALFQAHEADRRRRAGAPLGPLHGLPVGVKDIFDTHDMPTEDGTVLHQGRTPGADATAVARLRAAGAVILGKTVTAELAVLSPGKTRNPHDPERTPGGSSSGSAAAVAAGMVPLAIGTQTNGSMIRPAAFCGIHGYKPSHGLISRHRVLRASRRLDQIGVFARSVEDAALGAEPLMGFDERDPDTRPRAQPALTATVAREPPVPPRLAFVRSPVWEQAAGDTRAGLAELCEHLGTHVEEIGLPAEFDGAVGWHRTIMEVDLAVSFEREYERGRDRLSAVLVEILERGQRYPAVDYQRAVEQIPLLRGMLEQILQRYDAILTPAVIGEAPVGLESTGNPVFCTLWTLCGMPAITLPLLQGANGLPIGVQLVAGRYDDARLLRTARWLVELVESS